MLSWPSPLLKTIGIYYKPYCNTSLLNLIDFVQRLEVSCQIQKKRGSENVAMNLQKKNKNILSFDLLDHLNHL